MKFRTLRYEWRISVRKLVLLLAALLMYMFANAGPAYATFPGTNGQITFGRFNPNIWDFQIFVANPDGSHLFQLTTVPSEDSDWSPDGSRIAYDFFDGQTVQIATINPDGTGGVQLTHQENVFHGEPAWSPDATVLAFDSDAGNHPAGEGIYLMDASTGTVLSRVNANPFGWFDEQPRWSPDGQKITFTRVKKNLRNIQVTAIFVVRRDGTSLQQLTAWGLNANFPDWSPDGTKIVFNTNENLPAASGIWTVHPDGSGLTALVKTHAPQNFFHPRWSPDGTKVIFAGRLDPSQGVNLWTVNADGTDLTKITAISGPLGFLNFPDWGTHPLQ
jgi:Tol biopolymer transport system component